MPSMVGVIMRSMAWLSAILPKKSVSRGPRWRMRSGQQKRRAVGPTLINGSHNDPGICREYRDFQPAGKGEVGDLGMIYARTIGRDSVTGGRGFILSRNSYKRAFAEGGIVATVYLVFCSVIRRLHHKRHLARLWQGSSNRSCLW